MQEQISNAIEFLKKQDVKGCITGSCLLEYFKNQDIDFFAYDEKSFTKLIFALYYNPLFTILDPVEKWKFDEYVNKGQSSLQKIGLVTIKFTFNTCIPVNIIYKKSCTNIFAVLSSFDLNIICKGFDLETQQTLDLTTNPGKIVDWNRWNTAYYSTEVWKISRLLRQIERCFKYHNRDYNTDKVILKYMDLINIVLDQTSIFKSENYNEKLEILQKNLEIVLKICKIWLDTHTITDQELELFQKKIKTI